MIRTITLTGEEQKIEGLQAGLDSLLSSDLDSDGITKSYGVGVQPQILLKADKDNTGDVLITENTGDGIEKSRPIEPGESLTLDLNIYVKSKNQFYATGVDGEFLYLIAR